MLCLTEKLERDIVKAQNENNSHSQDRLIRKSLKVMNEKLNTNAQVVLDIVRTARDHPTALEIYEAVRLTRPRIGLASIYRILHQLTERGYVKELGRSDESCRYDGQTSRHDHAICTSCGALIDVPVEILLPQEILQEAARASGIVLSSHEVRLYGQCTSCLRNGTKSL